MTSNEKERLKNAALSIIDKYLADPENFELDLRDLDFRIKLNGEKWKGVVDKPVARFLLDLDKQIQSELARVGVPIPSSKHGVVALRIDEGSMDAFLENARGTLESLRKMKPYIQVLVLVTILSTVGIIFSGDIIEKLNDPKLEKIRAEERIELVANVAAIMENQRENEAPIRRLVESMDKEDKVLIPGIGEVKKDEAKRSFTKATRSRVYSYYIDFPYIVQELSTRKPGEWEIVLGFGEDFSFRAKMMISESEISELLGKFQEAHEKGTNIAVDLQVTAEINAKGVQRSTVIGLGDPRKNTVKLSQALQNEVDRSNSNLEADEEDQEEE